MPVFHTKTIESILEPVAQQVSRLVVLHEEAEDGNAMPNLTQSVHAVKLAVDNLVKIGYETTNTSQDEILKQDMPPALQRVEQAAEWLLEASKYLTEDPYSAPARKKLIEGSRGILQGTSDLLLAFDESEVRKIIVQCNAVMDYLNIAEVIENLTDLITFVKNISPGLTRMSKQVDDREKELTNQAHRTILQQCLEKIRELTPMLISSIKVHVNQMNANSPAESDSRSNRDYMCKSMCKQIQEIIRVLQLTSSEPEETTGDDAADMRNCAADMMNKFNAAHDWLADPQAVPGGIGDRAINDMLASALKAADRCPDHEAQQQIQKAVSDIKSMMDALSELRANGQGDTPQAHALSRSIEQKLGELVDLINGVANNVEKAGARATARTLQGRLEAAKAWLHAPTKQLAGMDGEAAARKVIADSRTLAKRIADGKTREELLRLCDEAEKQLDDLCLHCQYGTANTPQARAIAHALSSKLSEIEAAVNQAVNDKVVDVFLDVNGPLKALSAAANVPKDTPHREERYNDKSGAFNEHSVQLAESAALVAYSSSTQNKSTLDQIHHTAKQVAQLAPQVVSAGKIVLVDPSEESAQEHFELMKKQWADKSEKLRTLVDENTDPLTFIKSTEAAMIEDTGNVESSIIGVEPQGIVENAANIARRANRLIQLAQQEADNSEDPALRKDISLVSDRLKSLMPDMIKNAKLLTLNPRDYHAAETWRNSNNGLLDAVRGMRILMEGQQMTFQPLLSPGLPDMTDLSLCLSPEVYSKIYTYEPRTPVLTEPPNIGMAILTTPTSEEAPPRPPLPAEEAPPPRPPSPDPVAPDQDAELERVFKNQPQENQPILLAAHNLHQEVRHWDSSDNELIQAAKQMALLMARLSQIVRGEGGTKKDLIDIAKQIAEASEAVTRLAKGLAAECTDKRVRTNLLQVCERIPTIGTQLKILSTVKATMLGSQESSSQEDDEATEMLVGNAQNLMQSVKDAVHAAEGASIKIRVQSGYSIRWVRRRPWYA